MGNFMGPREGPSMDRVYISKGAGATVRQYRHVVTPLVCLEMHTALMHCAADNAEVLTEQQEAEHLEGDQARLAPYERGVFEVTDKDMNEVPPYQNDEFIQQVQGIATFDHVRAAPPAPLEPALLFSRDAHRHTPEVAADVVAQTCERLLTLREPGLRPTWGLDAENPPAADAHEGTEEHMREANRDRHTVDCGNSGMSPNFDVLQSLAGDASPLETDGSDSDLPAEAPSEPAPPPHPAAMGNASPL